MASELEDFLRRAAQRRVENAAAKGKPPQPPRPPEYADRNRERTPSTREDDDVIVADLVHSSTVEEPQDPQRNTFPIEVRAGSEVNELVGQRLHSRVGQGAGMLGGMKKATDDAGALPSDSPAVQALLRLLKDPDGINQAILAREILDRPTHRW